jgi:glutamine synthetase
LEVEFHLFKIENPRLAPADATWPPEAPEVSLLTQGYQYLTESRYDMLDPALEVLRRGIEQLGLPLRSVESELGPSQCEFTFRPQAGLASADTMVLCARLQADCPTPWDACELHVPPRAA